MANRPAGFTVAGILTSLGAAANLFFAILLIALFSVGGPPPSGQSPLPFFWWVMIFIPFLLALFSVIVTVGIFARVRYAWYWSIILWLVSAAYYSVIALYLPDNLKLAMASLIILIIALIIYFQTKPVKNYFLNPKTT